MRIRFNHRDTNVALARPAISVETAVAVSTPDNASPTEEGNRVAAHSIRRKDMVARPFTELSGTSWVRPLVLKAPGAQVPGPH